MDHPWGLPSEAKPAAYSPSSTTELESVTILENLLSKEWVKPYLKVNDKTPNFDGYLDITDRDGTPLGKLEVQIKTLPEEYYSSPRFSYERSFMAACQRSVNPPILIAVNRKDKIAFWQHVDLQTISDFFTDPSRKTRILSFPPENKIDGQDENYIESWVSLIEDALADKLYSSTQKSRIKELEDELEKWKKHLEVANLAPEIIQQIHIFLDHYNSLLEQDFKAIRKILYPAYWKIGIAIGAYSLFSLSYILLPIPYTQNDPMIMKLKQLTEKDFTSLFMDRGALLMSSTSESNPIRTTPLHLAYRLLDSDILRTIDKNHFAIEDNFAANEYIIGFIDTFSNYLGFEHLANGYNLDNLTEVLDLLLPVYEVTNCSLRSGPTSYDHHIDYNTNSRFRRSNSQSLAVVKEKLSQGFTPPVSVTLRSELFDLDLLKHYIRSLRSAGQRTAARSFLPDKSAPGVGMLPWKAWDRSILLANVQIFVENFRRVYTGLLKKNFPLLSEQLALDEQADLTIYTILSENDRSKKPLLRAYHLKATKPAKETKIQFFHEVDCPIDPADMYKRNTYLCILGGEEYQVTILQNRPLDFLFCSAPVFLAAHKTLKENMESYLKEKLKSLS